MNDFTLSVANVLQGDELLSNQIMVVSNGIIESISPSEEVTSQEPLNGTLVPGFIDLQVNGGGGILFNQSPTFSGIKSIAIAHQQFGTTAWLPTLITDDPDTMKAAADAVAESLLDNRLGVKGIHFEGPHLSIEKRGIHQSQYIRELSGTEREIYSRKDLGRVLVTVAPERVSTDVIAQLVSEGVLVCLGHSQATFEQTMLALEAGATGFTHLYNAMSQMQSREPGMVGAALLDKNSYAGIILDGVHVHPQSAKLAFSSKENMMLVTDAMPLVGSDESSFEYFEQTIYQKDGRLKDSEGRLAGSVLDMATAVNNCQHFLGYSLAKSIQFASENPAKYLGLESELGRFEPGKKASMALLDNKGTVLATWIEGQRVYCSV